MSGTQNRELVIKAKFENNNWMDMSCGEYYLQERKVKVPFKQLMSQIQTFYCHKLFHMYVYTYQISNFKNVLL